MNKRLQDLIDEAETILANPETQPFTPTLLLALLVEIAKSTAHYYDLTRPPTYETPTEAYSRGEADADERYRQKGPHR